MVEQLGDLRLQEDVVNSETVVLMMDGFIRNKETQALRRYTETLRTRGLKHLILDMRAVEYISSAGIGFLVVLTKEWQEEIEGGDVLIFGLHKKQRQVIETLGIIPLLNLVSDREEALKSLGLSRNDASLLLGVVSDSHANIGLLKDVSKRLVEEFKVNTVVHLGDNYDDAKVLDEYPIEKYVVPGVFSSYYADTEIPNRLFISIVGWRLLLSHTLKPHQNDIEGDVDPEEMVEKRKIDILLYGHTHIPNIEVKNKVLLMNPGNLKLDDKKHSPTFGLLKLTPRIAEASILDAETGVVIRSLKRKKES